MCLATLIFWKPPLAASLCFVLLPLGVLLLLSFPRTIVEWLWIGLAVAAGVSWRALPNDFSSHLTGAAALLFAGSFAIATLAGMSSLIHRALSAIAVTSLGLTAWFQHAGVSYSSFRSTVLSDHWVGLREFIPTLPTSPPAVGGDHLLFGAAATSSGLTASPTELATQLSALYPAYLAVGALAGVWLAWAVYCRIAATPLGRPAAPFHLLGFNDQLIWLLVVATALRILDWPAGWGDASGNVLLVLTVLYAVRGLAILATLFAMVSPVQVFLLTLIGLLLFPATAIVCVILGVADTWIDWRRRWAPKGVSP